MPDGVIVFDGDDTLWFVEPLYDDARQEARRVVVAAGHDGDEWEQLQRRIDVENVATMGVDRERFPLSCVQAYQAVAARGDGGPATAEIVEHVRAAARQVFQRAALPNPHAGPVLKSLRSEHALVLLTKGDPDVQVKRIADARLEDAFDQISIVPDKTPSQFREVLQALDTSPRDAWSVGNSLASDINPALRLGMSAVWVDAHVWEHERREVQAMPGHLVSVTSLAEVPDILRAERQLE